MERPREQPLPFGEHLLVERLGLGALAEVWRARDPHGRTVALKRPLPHVLEDPDALARFHAEAAVGLTLEHPGLVRTLARGQVGRCPFLVQEYVEGQDLRALWERCRAAGEPLPPRLAAQVLARVCDALHVLHARGLVHGDVSLANVRVGTAGEVKLLDLGLVRAEGQPTPGGRPGYASPEVAAGLAADRRADVWAVGVCLYELLTGERLRGGGTAGQVFARLHDADVPPPSRANPRVPAALDAITLRALAREPRVRHPGAQPLADELRRFLAETPGPAGAPELARLLRERFPPRPEAQDALAT